MNRTAAFLMGSAGLLIGLSAAAPAQAEEPKKEEAKQAEAPKKDPKDMNADEAEAAELCPVCKKPYKLVYHETVNAKTYHFDTRDCRKLFADDPSKYGVKAEKKEKKEAAPPPPKENEKEGSMEK